MIFPKPTVETTKKDMLGPFLPTGRPDDIGDGLLHMPIPAVHGVVDARVDLVNDTKGFIDVGKNGSMIEPIRELGVKPRFVTTLQLAIGSLVHEGVKVREEARSAVSHSPFGGGPLA